MTTSTRTAVDELIDSRARARSAATPSGAARANQISRDRGMVADVSVSMGPSRPCPYSGHPQCDAFITRRRNS